MLPAIRDNLEGLSEQESQHYTEKDGKYYLDVGEVNGVKVEDVSGLRKTVETLRSAERKLKSEMSSLETKYDGIDAGQARIAIAKYDEIKGFDKDGKVKEAIEAHKRDLVAQHKKDMDDVQAKYKTVSTQLDDAIVTAKVVEALQKEEGNVELLRPHVMASIVVKEGADGKRYPEVVGTNGEPRVGDGAGNPMTILQRVQEMKAQDAFAAAFKGANATGSDKSGSDTGTGNRSGGSNTITPTNGVVVGDIEKIASGQTKVKAS